jgi:hypothetical protein
MPQRPLPTTLVALAVAATLALSGCTAATLEAETAGDRDIAQAAATKTPFSPYWEAMYGVYDARDEIEKREEIEKLVTACMTAEGFEYTPVDQSPDTSVPGYEQGWGTESWVAEHGYGAFPTPEETRQIDAQVVAEDPNLEYVASLSLSEQEAYYQALDSPLPDRDALAAKSEGGETPAYDWTTAGCRGEAQHAVSGVDPTQSERFVPLVAAMNALEQEQQSDPAMLPIDAEWSECMADAGYDGMATKQSAPDAVFAQSSAYWDSGATDEPADDLRAEWRDFEIDVALVDFRCGEAVGYAAKARAVQAARETQFIADNKLELDAMLAEIEQGE